MLLFFLFVLAFLAPLYNYNAYGDERQQILPGRFLLLTSLENRYFFHPGPYENRGQMDVSLVIRPEYSFSWDQDRKVFTFIPYFRLSELDNEKTYSDIRQFDFSGSWEHIDVRVGISKVFWGVTEGLHLVDIVNQTDAILNVDGEDKLGTPMANITWVSGFGQLDYFFLPYFRERSFAGEKGRLRGPYHVDGKNPLYTHAKKNKHLDHAFRWSHYYEEFEWAISYFKGTDRTPSFIFAPNKLQLIPLYGQAKQLGTELQYTYADWLFKGETLRKKNDAAGENYFSSVMGLEYTFTNLFQGSDLGLLYEWIYDERDEKSLVGTRNSSFFALRGALNDEKQNELLFGLIVSHKNLSIASLRLETSGRINENLKWTLEGNFFLSPAKESFIYHLRDEDYIELALSQYF